ncbi:MAG: CvpA family protein [Chloroflexota bacterium]
MRELLNIIPYLDLAILALLIFFIYIGWSHGTPRLLMILGSIYSGFLLASIYYHLFAVALADFFNIESMFVADLISFLLLDMVITAVMVALLFNLFGHIQIRNRVAIFDRIMGTVLGLCAGVLIVGILVTMLRIPYEANKQKLDASAELPVVQLFNQGYDRSFAAPYLVKGAPYFLLSIKPLLPPEAQEKGTVPLLESVALQEK